METFKREYGSEFDNYHDAITDINFAKATTKLVPGRRMKVKVFQMNTPIRVSSESCHRFLKSQKAILVGAQGLTLAYEQGKDKLPKGKWHVSFDEK